MRVSEYLDLEDGSVLLGRAHAAWPDWVASDPRLAVVGLPGGLELRELRRWLEAAEPAVADGVLLALAARGAQDGGDDLAAAALLAWSLLPGACRLAHQLRHLGPRSRRLVATQLWIEVRTFKWRRLHRVAGNVLMNTRAGCLLEAEATSQVARVDRAWSSTQLVSPSAPMWEQVAVGVLGDRSDEVAARRDHLSRRTVGGAVDQRKARPEASELADVLEWALANGVITAADCDFLLLVLEEAEVATVPRSTRQNMGLTGSEIALRVGSRCGVSQATVRRRMSSTIRALAEAAAGYAA